MKDSIQDMNELMLKGIIVSKMSIKFKKNVYKHARSESEWNLHLVE
ncbi:unnamed protein product [Paramecium sonneborni]|uniref:Uncharacterized protein n=1 Tax=Paramecium sonneborni TaxID=65129 RepID=A0A8S1QBT8_9CILI|nr:unnamed protein product [Paramecium sonneborni]